MNTQKSTKGFTLIELLIVIAIIGILAVAFLPTLLGAPSKGRDTARIADLQKIQKVLVNNNLEKGVYPADGGAIVTGLTGANGVAAGPTWGATFGTAFGGTLPDDPTIGKDYRYLKKSETPGSSYSFGLWAEVEILENANGSCATAVGGAVTIEDPATPAAGEVQCYAVLTQ